MTEARINEIISAIGTNEARIKTLVEMSPEEASAKLHSEGFDISAEELIEFGRYCAEHGTQDIEMDEEQLENVSGGSVTAAVLLIGVLAGMMLARKNPW